MALTQAIDFGTLIGTQITALIDAESLAAEKTAEYIQNVGFESDGKGEMHLRTVTFRMQRQDETGKMREHFISIPILTLVPIPLLSIEEANMEFDLKIEQIRQSDSRSTQTASAPKKEGIINSLRNRSKLAAKQRPARLMTRLSEPAKTPAEAPPISP